MNDLISRKMAIYQFRLVVEDEEGNWTADDAVEMLERLPSLEPEIIRCKDCTYFRKAKDPFQMRQVCWCKLRVLGRREHLPINDETYCSMAERGDKDEHRV